MGIKTIKIQKTDFIEVIGIILLLGIGFFHLTYQLPLVSATYDEDYSYLGDGEYLVRYFKWDKQERPYILLHPPLFYYLHGWSSLVFEAKNVDERLYIARLSMIPLYPFFAILLYLVSRKWYGRIAALGTLVLYLFNPEILAHARFITPDHMLAFMIFAILLGYYAFLHKPHSLIHAVLTGLCLGVALLTKYTSLLLVPLVFFLGIIFSIGYRQRFRPIFIGTIGVVIIAILLLHPGYLFRETGRLPEPFVSQRMQAMAKVPGVVPLLATVFPRAYLAGVDFQIHESSKGIWWGFFASKYYFSGLWYFYPAVFAIKTPLPFLIILVIALGALLFRKLHTKPFITTLILVTVAWFFLYFMFFNKLIIGLRYLLMVYPLLFLLVAPIWTVYISRVSLIRRIGKGILVGLLVWYVWGSVKIAPFYLAFANETIGGPKNIWKYVGDSNLDWDQDRKFFADYRKKHPELTVINPHKPTLGKFAVNVNDMNLYNFDSYQWLRKLNKDPVDYIGYTWLIFEVSREDLNQL